MRIRKLRLSGFKSFVEPAELIIERGLTGIVGPNGCGKSNLLEAIRWVMGESSPKSMRWLIDMPPRSAPPLSSATPPIAEPSKLPTRNAPPTAVSPHITRP